MNVVEGTTLYRYFLIRIRNARSGQKLSAVLYLYY